MELTGNPATETLRFSRKGPSHWPGLGHVWKQGLASCLNMYLRVHAQLCLTLRGPMDGSPPTSSVHGTLQARMLEWVAMSSCRASSRPRDHTVSPVSAALQAGSLPLSRLGSPSYAYGSKRKIDGR